MNTGFTAPRPTLTQHYLRMGFLCLFMISLLVAFFCQWSGSSDAIIKAGTFAFICGIILSTFLSGSGSLSASVLCLMAFAFYALAVPLHHLFNQDYDDSGVQFVTSMCVVGLAGQIFGYLLMGKPRFTRMPTPVDTSSFGLSVIILGTLALIIAIGATSGFSAYFQAGYAGRALLKREVGPVELGLYYIVVGYLFVAFNWLFRTSGRRSVGKGFFLLSFLGVFVVYVSFLGIRRPSFFMVFSLITLYFLSIRGKASKSILLLALFMAFLFGIFAQFRQVLSDHGAMEALAYVFTHFDFSWFDLSSSELGAPFRTMLDVKDSWIADGWQWGQSYLDALVNVFPSSMVKYRDSLSVQYTNTFFTQDYIAIGGNMGFFPVTEAYLNFGALGVFFEFFILGLFIKYVENRAVEQADVVHTVICAIMVPWFFFFLRTDFSSFLKSFTYSIIPVFFAYLLFTMTQTLRRHPPLKTV